MTINPGVIYTRLIIFLGQDLEIQLETITTDDVVAALAKTKPSARAMAKKYLDWQHEYESV